MKFIANKKANIKTDNGWILVYPGDEVKLPSRFRVNPALDSVKEKVKMKKLAEVKGDIADDGMMNYSNNPNKKSPGRKKKQKKRQKK